MLVIIVTIITQGFRVPAELRGKFSVPLLTVNSGVFQAIGVISFGIILPESDLKAIERVLTFNSVCLP
jgi:solute carrier family 38 (sodium-coupled neutral amino acid transporter), member 11